MTLDELNAWFDETFHCVDGPYRAYFELPLPAPAPSSARFVYVTIGLRMQGDDVEGRLVAAFQQIFLSAMAASVWYQESIEFDSFGRPLLFWRRRTKLEIDVDQRRSIPTLTTLSARLVVPGLALMDNRPENDFTFPIVETAS